MTFLFYYDCHKSFYYNCIHYAVFANDSKNQKKLFLLEMLLKQEVNMYFIYHSNPFHNPFWFLQPRLYV